MQQHEQANGAKRRRQIATIVSLFIILVLVGLLTWAVWAKLEEIGSPENFRDFIDSFGISGWLIGFGIQFLQVVIALIPGEIVEIGLGCAFGAVGGTLLCMVGVAAASALVFLITKRFGLRVVELFFPREKIDSLWFINNEKRLKATVFILFFIPGTPKDLLTYFVGLTRMKLSEFLVISLIARIPSVVSSTIGGNLISEQNYLSAVILFAVTAAVSLGGILLYNLILKKKSKTEE